MMAIVFATALWCLGLLLSDVILSLNVLVESDSETPTMDVNDDGLFGKAEIIYMLQRVATDS